MKPYVAFLGLAFLLVAAQARAVTYGWQELPDGGVEYLVQVEPFALDAFRETGFWSEIPAGTKEIRRITLKIGDAKLPHEGTAPPPAPIQSPKPPEEEPATTNSVPGTTPTANGNIDTEPARFEGHTPKPLAGGPTKDLWDRASNATTSAAERATEDFTGEHSKNLRDVPNKTFKPGIDVDLPIPAESRKEIITTPESRPWLPLMLTLVGLFASLGANAYLAMLYKSLRSNYRSIVATLPGERATA